MAGFPEAKVAPPTDANGVPGGALDVDKTAPLYAVDLDEEFRGAPGPPSLQSCISPSPAAMPASWLGQHIPCTGGRA